MEQPMNVTRVKTATGDRVEPSCDDTWDEETKLRWHAAVVAHDTGLPIEICHSNTGDRPYGFRTSQTGGAPYDFHGAWDLLNGIAVGARKVVAQVQKLHRPVEHHGQTICTECSAYGDESTDNAPIAHPCATIQALGGEQP
jgi:hypothetical protein